MSVALRKESLSSSGGFPEFNQEELYLQFKLKAEAISAEVYRAHNVEEAKVYLSKILQEYQSPEVVAMDCPLGREMDLTAMVEGMGGHIQYKELQEHALHAQIGISQLDFAIAETGSLVQDATNVNKRLVSSLPPVHIALVPTKGLVRNFMDMIEILARKFSEAAPRFLAFISGPSRTSDIERVLTIGVHGPERLVIIFVD